MHYPELRTLLNYYIMHACLKYSTWSFPVLITSCVYIICVTVSFSQFNHISSIELVGCVTTLTGDEVKLTMATYGKVKAFNPKSDDWEVYA